MAGKRTNVNRSQIPTYPLPAARPQRSPRPVSDRPAAGGPLPVSAAPTELWLPAPPPRQSNWLLRLVVATAVLVFLFLGVMTAGGAVLLYESSWIVPGVDVLGLDLGRQTTATAAGQLDSYWQSRQVTLTADGASWQVTPTALGITLDVPATVAAAHGQGRSWSSLRQGWRRGGRFTVAPVWQIDMNQARASLAALAPELTVPPVDAGMVLVNGRFEATPALPGRALDLEATLADLERQAADAVLGGHLALTTTPTPATVIDVSQVVAAANSLLQTTLSLRAYDPITDDRWTWQLGADVWGPWLTVNEAAAASGRLDWALDTARAGAYIDELIGALGGGRYVNQEGTGAAVAQAMAGAGGGSVTVGVRVYHRTLEHVVQAGETLASIGREYGIPYPWIEQANPAVETLFTGQTLTIPSPDELVPLPVVEDKRIEVSITQQKVRVYENEALKWEWAASTGIADSPTAPGVFQVQSHEPNAYAGNWDLWMPDFMGIYRPVPTSDFMNGFHGFPTRNGTQLLWTGSLGRPVTYGCILISSDNARQLYEWAEAGVIVEIQP